MSETGGPADRRAGGRMALVSRLPLLPFLPFLLSACELTEVTVPEGEPRVIVQSVFSARERLQFVVVERSLTGTVPTSEADWGIPPGEPRIPLTGALVTLVNETRPEWCRTDTLLPRDAGSGVYLKGYACGALPGERLRLRVETAEGDVVTGTTTVPGARWVSVRLATDSATAERQVLELDRARDTIRIAVDPILVRAMQVEIRELYAPDSVAVFLFTDSLGVALPGDLYNPFAGDSGKPVFALGVVYTLTVAVTDSNYYDFVRSRSDPFTGRGFLNRLEGGIGVFGSVEAYTYYLRVVR
jgi:hypothetical protein